MPAKSDSQSQPLEIAAKHLSTSAVTHRQKRMTKAVLLAAVPQVVGLTSTANIGLLGQYFMSLFDNKQNRG